MVEFGSRQPLIDSWHIDPMPRIGYVDYENGFSNEYVIMPTVKTS
jgi:hypothetical protein